MKGNNIIDPKGLPPCLRGCAHFIEMTLLDGTKIPKCLLQLMVLSADNNEQLYINVSQCPQFISREDYQKLLQGTPTSSIITEG